MFRWQNTRIRVAEKALAQGRLDDAVTAVRELDLAQSGRGRRLLEALARALTARARLHRQAGRYRAALGDLDAITALGHQDADLGTLRQRISEEMQGDAQRQHDEAQVYERAADHVQAGRLDTGRLQVERVDDPRRREQLAAELNVRMERGAALIQQAGEALDRDDVLAAVRVWQDATGRHGRTAETDRFATRLAQACREKLDQWHQQGRIDVLLAAHAGVAALRAHDPTLSDCERLTELCATATRRLAAGDYTALRQTLLKIKAIRGEVPWVKAALGALAQIAEGQELLMASPLGLYASAPGAPQRSMGQTRVAARTVALSDDVPAGGLRLDQPLLMLVDGGGSSLILGADRVRIGRVGSSTPVDVPIPGDLDAHHADIIRRGDDYFLSAYGSAEVNRQAMRQALLREGDRITLGDGVRLTFHRPSSKSASAVLRLSHRARLPQDVSDVVLFSDTCIVGAGGTCHVRTREDLGQVVLFERGGALCVRQTAGNGHLTAAVRAVTSGASLTFGDLRLTVKPYETATKRTI